MLSSSYLAGCSDEIVKIYSQLENDIICDMVRRIAKVGKVTDATEWQAKILKELSSLNNDISKYVTKYDKQTQAKIKELFAEAMQKATDGDTRGLSDNQKQLLNTATNEEYSYKGAKKTYSVLQSLNMTLSGTITEEFIAQANSSFMQVASGAFDYNTALKKAVDNLADKGLQTVIYTGSGKKVKRSIEAAVRANIMTGVNQTASAQTLQNAKDLGTNLFEVSAHMGARPEHASWQGKVYTEKELVNICGLGTIEGLCGINCRHSYYPYFEGDEKHYSKDELDELKEPKVKYNGKEITQYEASQNLRACERAIRKYKLKANALSEANLDNTQARVKISEWQKTARDLVEQTGLKRDYAREYIGTKSGK